MHLKFTKPLHKICPYFYDPSVRKISIPHGFSPLLDPAARSFLSLVTLHTAQICDFSHISSDANALIKNLKGRSK